MRFIVEVDTRKSGNPWGYVHLVGDFDTYAEAEACAKTYRKRKWLRPAYKARVYVDGSCAYAAKALHLDERQLVAEARARDGERFTRGRLM